MSEKQQIENLKRCYTIIGQKAVLNLKEAAKSKQFQNNLRKLKHIQLS